MISHKRFHYIIKGQKKAILKLISFLIKFLKNFMT